jgi:hypothetical protein
MLSKYTVKYKTLKEDKEQIVEFKAPPRQRLQSCSRVDGTIGLNLYLDTGLMIIPWHQIEWANVDEKGEIQ